MKRTVLVLAALTAAVAAALAACSDMLYSDSANQGRRHARLQREALAASRSATLQAAAATPLAGDALAGLLSGKTHVHEYRRGAGDAKPYFVVYDHYRPDGVFIGLDSYSRRDATQVAPGRWRVAGATLCVTEKDGNPQEQCYAVAQEAGGRLQFRVAKPGDAFDGLLTSVVSIVRDGPQTPTATNEYPYR